MTCHLDNAIAKYDISPLFGIFQWEEYYGKTGIEVMFMLSYSHVYGIHCVCLTNKCESENVYGSPTQNFHLLSFNGYSKFWNAKIDIAIFKH